MCVCPIQTRVLRQYLLASIGDEALATHRIVVGDPSSFQVRNLGVFARTLRTLPSPNHDLPTVFLVSRVSAKKHQQGDERDVILLSMVASRGAAPTQVGRMYEQRFNVALSRARDRMVLFRSLDSKDIANRDDMKVNLTHLHVPMNMCMHAPHPTMVRNSNLNPCMWVMLIGILPLSLCPQLATIQFFKRMSSASETGGAASAAAAAIARRRMGSSSSSARGHLATESTPEGQVMAWLDRHGRLLLRCFVRPSIPPPVGLLLAVHNGYRQQQNPCEPKTQDRAAPMSPTSLISFRACELARIPLRCLVLDCWVAGRRRGRRAGSRRSPPLRVPGRWTWNHTGELILLEVVARASVPWIR